jgi:hypothetical protein
VLPSFNRVRFVAAFLLRLRCFSFHF